MQGEIYPSSVIMQGEIVKCVIFSVLKEIMRFSCLSALTSFIHQLKSPPPSNLFFFPSSPLTFPCLSAITSFPLKLLSSPLYQFLSSAPLISSFILPLIRSFLRSLITTDLLPFISSNLLLSSALNIS